MNDDDRNLLACDLQVHTTMRARATGPEGLTVTTISGTHVVLLAMDLPQGTKPWACRFSPDEGVVTSKSLLGFAIHRKSLNGSSGSGFW